MIKWAECREGELLYEFFLPEHEAEACQWLLRASARGHVLEERRGGLTWTPRFGPDMGDVAVVEAVTDQLAQKFTTYELPEHIGSYVPQESKLPNVDPMSHAIHYGLVAEFTQAEQELGITPRQTADYLRLPVQQSAAGLHPFAVTPERASRMRRLVALMQVSRNHPETAKLRPALLEAVLAEDIPLVKRLLADLGLPIAPDESMPR